MTANAPKILLVEDDDMLLLALQEVLTGEGYDVWSASCAQEALSYLGAGPFSLAILDWGLPRHRNSGELVSEMHKLDCAKCSGVRTPYVLITGLALGPVNACLSCLAKEDMPSKVFPKPFDVAEFLTSIRGIAKNR